METEHVLAYLDKLTQKAEALTNSSPELIGLSTRAREFFRVHVGDKSEFYNAILFLDEKNPDREAFVGILRNYRAYIEDGLSTEFTPLQQAQVNVVSDFLEQAFHLLRDNKVHPAAVCIVTGAALEEFLRNWIDRKKLRIGNRTPGIVAYSDALSQAELISRQDAKDILAWGGLRNEAAHGKWADLGERQRAKLMLEGVNLFMRKYTEQSAQVPT